jgi:tripartite-type tricarboxylate transporter receptor subunit TctC
MMKLLKNLMLSIAVLMAAGAFSIAPSAAQTYPSQRITIIVPFGPGSVTDILARIIADDMSKRSGQQVIVENRPGIPGTAAVAKAAPDGYTLMVTSNGHTVSRLVSKDAPFDPVKDFAGVTRLVSSPLYLIANPNAPAKTIKKLIEFAQKEPGKLNYSSAGLASTTGIAGTMFCKEAGIKMTHVPYRGAPDALTAVIRGDVQYYFVPVNIAKEQTDGGKVIAIAAATTKRIPDLPNVPTVTEAGLPFVYDSWFGLMAPAGTPKPILEKIAKEWGEALKTPEMQKKLADQFVVGVSDTPDAFNKIIADDTAKMTAAFKEAGIGN